MSKIILESPWYVKSSCATTTWPTCYFAGVVGDKVLGFICIVNCAEQDKVLTAACQVGYSSRKRYPLLEEWIKALSCQSCTSVPLTVCYRLKLLYTVPKPMLITKLPSTVPLSPSPNFHPIPNSSSHFILFFLWNTNTIGIDILFWSFIPLWIKL